MKKNLFCISLVLLFCTSCSDDNDKGVIEKNTKLKVFEWFAKYKSIDYEYNHDESKSQPSTEQTKTLRITSNKIQIGFENRESWSYIKQDYDVSYLDIGKCLVQIKTYFTNESNIIIRTETYYYDQLEPEFDEYILPLSNKIERLTDHELIELSNEKIWKGDFDYILKQLNEF